MSLAETTWRTLEEGAETLRWAWDLDKKCPKLYPHNTGFAFNQIKAPLGSAEILEKPTNRKSSKGAIPPRPPKKFSQLIDDATIKLVYEDQNATSYKDALERAARGDRSTFRKILRAIEKVYRIDQLGVEGVPPPKIHFLHKNLFEIANLSGLNELEDDGILEFLEDLCPCGKLHTIEAVRKFRKRWPIFSKPKT